jgi:hypothetical protein
MAILCGNRAKHDDPTHHATVAEVRACFAGSDVPTAPQQPVRTAAPVHEDGIQELSQYWGYGETCAGNLGWPYYEVAEAHQAVSV